MSKEREGGNPKLCYERGQLTHILGACFLTD